MRVITDRDELQRFYNSFECETDGSNFAFAGGKTLVHFDKAHTEDKEYWFIEVYQSKDDFLARVDEVGQAHLDGKLVWEQTIVFDNEYEARFVYTDIILGGIYSIGI